MPENDAKTFATQDLKNHVELQRSDDGEFAVFNSVKERWMGEYEDYQTPLDGTYRDNPNVWRWLRTMETQRTKDNYTHCSGIAPFVVSFIHFLVFHAIDYSLCRFQTLRSPRLYFLVNCSFVMLFINHDFCKIINYAIYVLS